MERFRQLLDELEARGELPREKWLYLLSHSGKPFREVAAEKARALTLARFGEGVYVRGLVEFSNHCANDCFYCGIRRSNSKLERYRLDEEEILECCEKGYRYGFRTFVFQSGEDPLWGCERLCGLVRRVKARFPECAVTLSVGELAEEEYRHLYEAGASRYLLRHESADPEHYAMIHPQRQKLCTRMACLEALKRIGFQTGCGFMVGTPGQELRHIACDMEFMSRFRPHMIGIGPFIPHRDTPFGKEKCGSGELTLLLLSLCRIMQQGVLLPATTALGTLLPDGREQGVLAGANVIMPDISPAEVRKLYSLYDNKAACDPGTAGILNSELQKKLESVGRHVVIGRGDFGERSC